MQEGEGHDLGQRVGLQVGVLVQEDERCLQAERDEERHDAQVRGAMRHEIGRQRHAGREQAHQYEQHGVAEPDLVHDASSSLCPFVSLFPEVAGEILAACVVGLLQDVVHVRLHGSQRQLQLARDVLIVLALQHEGEDLPLACGHAVAFAVRGQQVVDLPSHLGVLGCGRLLEPQPQRGSGFAQAEERERQHEEVLGEVALGYVEGQHRDRRGVPH